MLQISDLPRKDGLVVGEFIAHHKSDSFALEGFGFKFVNGVTTGPVAPRAHERLHAAYGSDVVFVPANQESAALVLDWLSQRSIAKEYVQDLAGAFSKLFVNEAEHAKRNVETVASLKAQDVSDKGGKRK